MSSASSRLRKVAIGLVVVATMAVAYGAGYHFGYRAGLSDKGPQHRALVVVRRTAGQPELIRL